MNETGHAESTERNESLPSEPEPVSLIERLGAGIEVAVVALGGVLAAPFFLMLWGVGPEEALKTPEYLFVILVSEATVSLVLVKLFLFFEGRDFRAIGLELGDWSKEVLIGAGFVPFLFLVVAGLKLIFMTLAPDWVTRENPLLGLIETPRHLVLFLLSSVYVGGIKEEIQRAFVLTRFDERLGGIWLGLLLWSFFFGYGHLMQGPDNAIGAGILGICFGLLYILRRNLIAVITAHALYDIATLLIYYAAAE